MVVVVEVTGQQQAEGAHGHSNEAATRSVHVAAFSWCWNTPL